MKNKEAENELARQDIASARQAVKEKVITLDQVMQLIEQDDCMGLCVACGAEAYGVEPDARRYQCESCGAHQVFGAEELLMYVG
jgi:hypothetical protein